MYVSILFNFLSSYLFFRATASRANGKGSIMNIEKISLGPNHCSIQIKELIMFETNELKTRFETTYSSSVLRYFLIIDIID